MGDAFHEFKAQFGVFLALLAKVDALKDNVHVAASARASKYHI
jgi:hypothetical protein